MASLPCGASSVHLKCTPPIFINQCVQTCIILRCTNCHYLECDRHIICYCSATVYSNFGTPRSQLVLRQLFAAQMFPWSYTCYIHYRVFNNKAVPIAPSTQLKTAVNCSRDSSLVACWPAHNPRVHTGTESALAVHTNSSILRNTPHNARYCQRRSFAQNRYRLHEVLQQTDNWM